MPTVTLYRPVGPKELALIEASGFTRFPPRLPEQPIFYPVMNEKYATDIARNWNVKESGAGFVTRFAVEAEFAAKYPVQTVGSREHQELWVPAEELEEFQPAHRGEDRGDRGVSVDACVRPSPPPDDFTSDFATWTIVLRG